MNIMYINSIEHATIAISCNDFLDDINQCMHSARLFQRHSCNVATS